VSFLNKWLYAPFFHFIDLVLYMEKTWSPKCFWLRWCNRADFLALCYHLPKNVKASASFFSPWNLTIIEASCTGFAVVKQHLPLTQQWAHGGGGERGDYRTRGMQCMIERQCEGYRKKLTIGSKEKTEFFKHHSVSWWCCWLCRSGWKQKLMCVTCWALE
jgi:hypothetical protein